MPRVREMNMQRDIRKEYRSLLKDYRWLEFSAEIIQRIRFCQWCGVRDNLQVHHKTYRNVMPWEYPIQDLMVLCRTCHEEIHHYADLCWGLTLHMNWNQIYLLSKALKTINEHRGELTGSHVIQLKRLIEDEQCCGKNKQSASDLLLSDWDGDTSDDG